MKNKPWRLLIAGFLVIEGLILVTNKVFYQQIQDLEKTSQTDRALFKIQDNDAVSKKVKSVSVVFAGLPHDPLAPRAVKDSPADQEKPVVSGSSERIYETALPGGILIQ